MAERGLLATDRVALARWEDGRVIFNDEALIEAVRSGMTTADIMRAVGCSRFPVCKARRRLGISGKRGHPIGAASGPRNPSWKGGRRVKEGYIEVWTPDGHRYEHRLVMERHLGRKLHSDEVVHHKDGNKQNNSIENLELMSRRDHALEHQWDMHAARYGWACEFEREEQGR